MHVHQSQLHALELVLNKHNSFCDSFSELLSKEQKVIITNDRDSLLDVLESKTKLLQDISMKQVL